MSILLLPFKIVFLIVAFILKGVLYLLAFILNFISEVLVALQYILGSVFVLVAIGGTIVLVRNIQNGSLTGLQGGDRLFMAHIHGFQHDVLFKQCGG